jgi:hypothetical protein
MPTDNLEDDHGEALDAFARMNAPPPATIPAAGLLGPAGGGEGMRVIGSQRVAVPRNQVHILDQLRVLAAAAGEDWYYRWPVKNKRTGETDWVEGPSIKLANELNRLYGNCEIETRVIDLGDSWLIYARFTDYESGYSLTRPYQQRKSQRTMGERATSEDKDRARDIAFQIGVSKAVRNVTVNALGTFADFGLEEAKKSLINKIGRSLESWRDATIEKLAAKIDIKRAEMVIGRPAPEWLATDVARVIAMMRAVKDGMSSWDETFPPLIAAAAPGEAPSGKLDEFAKTDSGASPVPGASDAAAEGEDAISPPASSSAAKPSTADRLDFGDAP